MEWTPQDRQQFSRKGIPLASIEEQLERFRKGFAFTAINRPATPGDGILCLTAAEQQRNISLFEQVAGAHEITRFIPASGAASRMFKDLFTTRQEFTPGGGRHLSAASENFFTQLRKFAFREHLSGALSQDGLSLDTLLSEKEYGTILTYLLDDKGLDYGNKPKGQILFHRYAVGNRTAFEEHLVEATGYATRNNGEIHHHFTVSPEHITGFEELLTSVQEVLEKRYRVTYRTGFSIQKPSTDTLAVDPENKAFRLEDGSILFRPGGHGALIENLNDLDTSLVFIKNIDNVAPDHLKADTFYWKKVLGGTLLYYQEILNKMQRKLDAGEVSAREIQEMYRIAGDKLGIDIHTKHPGTEHLRSLLFRPVRVCGMVKNEGEPGGGPFWVTDSEGRNSLQIVESAQIDPEDEQAQQQLGASTHFNPVDLVCSVRDHRGRKYDLRDFIDNEAGFISSKSAAGRPLKALELPGLWNGAMAGWITFFVEVPPSTFSPVKTVNDLLRSEHQPPH